MGQTRIGSAELFTLLMEAMTLVSPGLAAVAVPIDVELSVRTSVSAAENVNCPSVEFGIVQGAVVPSEVQTAALVLWATAVKTWVWPLERHALPMGSS